MIQIHDINTKIYREPVFWHIIVCMDIGWDITRFEMSNPMDRNGINMILDYYFIEDEEEIDLDELMSPAMEQYRTAIKLRQEHLIHTYNIWAK